MYELKYINEGNFYFPYSDIEKTFIDLVYFNEKISDEVFKKLRSRIDKTKLNSYLKSYPERIKKKVLKLLDQRVV